MPSSHLILFHPLLLLPPIPPSISVFSSESTLCMRWPKYWSFSLSISPSNEHLGLVSAVFKNYWVLIILELIHCMQFDCMYPEKAVAPHSSTLAWKIPWKEEPGGLQSMGWLRVRQDSATSLSLFTFMHWRRKWQPTPVFLPGESQGQGSLVGCLLWGHTESDTTEVTWQQVLHSPYPTPSPV